MNIKYKGRPVELEFDSNRDGSMFVSSGFYTDDNKDLTDEEMDDITDNYFDVMYDAHLDRLISAADFMEDR
jgi:hypothetical protein